MRSFQRQPDNRRAIYLQLAGSIESQLRQAYAKRHEEDNVTQADLAEKIGVNRSVVNRRLSGQSNMTIETIADMVWALGYCARVEIFDPDAADSNKFMIRPQPAPAPVIPAGPDARVATGSSAVGALHMKWAIPA